MRISSNLQSALDHGRPVVALESTLITHGLPFPENVETARRLEAAVRESGALPATIAILDGEIRVGLSDVDLDRLGQGTDAKKLNLSNFAAGVASGKPGSTTVAATMHIAHLAGIRVFATGGIGGVHRGASESFDVSADMAGLARYQVAVVCAGAKAILDLPKTTELLESLGVPILGWQTDEFPAFYRRLSGLKLDARFDDMAALARAASLHWSLGFQTGVLVANPIPADKELRTEIYEPALAKALAEADRQGVKGRDVTPFLLEAMRQATAGESVFSNTALLENNARVGGLLAVELATRGRVK